jgi:hypothetical protein
MNDKRTIRFVAILIFLLAAIMTIDLWQLHDLSAFYEHIMILLCVTFLFVLFLRFCRNWKLFKTTIYTIQFVSFGALAIRQWIQGSHWIVIVTAPASIIALMFVFEEIGKLKACETFEKE